MNQYERYTSRLRDDLRKISSDEKAESSRRYFPDGINCIGANAADIKSIITGFHSDFYSGSHSDNAELTAIEVLAITEHLLSTAQCHEDNLVAFGLLNKLVKKNYDDDLLLRFEYWLEHYTNNWAQVDDLCIKTIYQFLLARPHLIEKTQHWANSEVSWCRRASNVVWVKFIKRGMGKSTYYLDKQLVFNNCDLLIDDTDEFVQKSIGWLLKVTSQHYEDDVIKYIENNVTKMTRSTMRCAIEKMDAATRQRLLSLK
ncbi:DNA alkylation repair protein [Shewanella sp. D64]|uniref:DNA alkylation repair protein n=1 Tax=unclassified Shewanella TaxID=196818 RepID=UPI0022BA1DF2|nr:MULTISPECIES: DNA alkylation repair protein [unclassified Shewanella]MEC4727642.1 DNA alkylation repair protein [Shewanella sp. D64]MEC4739785.1 DNA alkylation repair protein [Shewanella sp. E94]WBJ94041.1 DNA alkylation repair protein [Shewanella sp. MTB7]